MGEEEEGGESQEVRGIAIEVEGAAAEHHHGHDRGPQDRHVAAHEGAIEREGGGQEQRARERCRTQPPEEPAQEGGDHGHLGAGQREHVVGAGHAEGLGRFRIQGGALPQHHRAHEGLLTAERKRGGEACARPPARPRGAVAEPSRRALAGGLHEARALAPSHGMDSVAPRLRGGVEGAGIAQAAWHAQLGPQRDAIAFDEIGSPGQAADVDARPARHRQPRHVLHVEDEDPFAARVPCVGMADAAQLHRSGVGLAEDPRPQGRGIVLTTLDTGGGGADGEGRGEHTRAAQAPAAPGGRSEAHRDGDERRRRQSHQPNGRAQRQTSAHGGADGERARHRDERAWHDRGSRRGDGEAGRRLPAREAGGGPLPAGSRNCHSQTPRWWPLEAATHPVGGRLRQAGQRRARWTTVSRWKVSGNRSKAAIESGR